MSLKNCEPSELKSRTERPCHDQANLKLTRRQLFKRLAAFSIVPAVLGYYANQVEPFWPRYFEFPIRLKGLPKSFENFRIAQVTDMHAGRVPQAYLQRVVDKVKQLKPDLVAFTGDMINHHPDYVTLAVQLLSGFSCPVLVSFGNHEFAPDRGEDEPYDPFLAEKVEDALRKIGCVVLRNASHPLTHPDGRVWIVGLDDLWFGDFDPRLAFQNVPSDETVIVMSHNPDTAYLLAEHRPDLILSGHTHGGQIRLPGYGALRLNVAKPQYDMGHFQLPNSQLYVSTGVGYIRRVRFNCRPEVPVFRLIST